ncbi:MAG: TIGR03915 family putative DNA repair protein [Coriobacteriales bacterium]|nr:TIGR03915 family putative DNA repair protein [Coriobacteriales bacterium]
MSTISTKTTSIMGVRKNPDESTSATGAVVVEPALDGISLVYLYDASLEGLLTAVFVAFERKECPVNLTTEHNLQHSLMCSYVPVATDLHKAARVKDGIIDKLGVQTYEEVKRVFLSDNPKKGGEILRFLQYAFKRGMWSGTHLAHPVVDAFRATLKQVESEAHYMLQFVRFAHLQSGLYFSRIEPKANVVPLIMNHFAARFNIQPFVILDTCHRIAGVFDTTRWWLVDAGQILSGEQAEAGGPPLENDPSGLVSARGLPACNLAPEAGRGGGVGKGADTYREPAGAHQSVSDGIAAALDVSAAWDNSAEEDEFQALWQTFFDTIAIEERRNPTCQRNFMPKRFWGDLCEQVPPELRKARPKTTTPTQASRYNRLVIGTTTTPDPGLL